jgi:hypothetical protein
LHIQETKPKIQKVPLIDATREELQEALWTYVYRNW